MPVRVRSLVVVGALTLAAACRGDVSPTAPTSTAMPAAVAFKRVRNVKTADTARVVQRKVAFASDVTASTVIGSDGGTLELRDAGLTLIVPAGAVASDQTFSITAVAGNLIAYEFAPHMAFAKPVRLEQKLSFFEIPDDVAGVSLGYFATRADIGAIQSDVGTIQEQLPITFDLSGGTARADVVHFSGYLMASGRSGGRNK